MAIKVGSETEAWDLANTLIPHVETNHRKSDGAGYKILEDTRGNCISVLGGRLELNFNNGNTMTIWIEYEETSTGNMKSREEVERRISVIEQRITWCKDDIARATQELKEKIDSYADVPNYVARNMENWMRPIADSERAMGECHREIEMLKWVIT